ncbi:aminodeoxychorismate/anthranilate synthase component II [Acidobacteria bacterium AH-259-A15]|nr:aminodeoxychorismate/anthranilate synthase component II [Acidobacteria bacterium AH-259-A15]
MNVLVLDNYDSFTYNLVQYLGELGCEIEVYRNDAITLADIQRINPERIVISPGPGVPRDAGISIAAIRNFAAQIPILGVCLGHQAIGEAFGGKVVQAPQLMHGKTSLVYHESDSVLSGLSSPFEATRYHSLIVRRDDLPDCLIVNAWTDDGLIMGLRHREHDLFGVQFHPESVMTREGKRILENFLELQE